jgi:membrane-associated protein
MIEVIKHGIDLFLHIDRHLQDVIAHYGLWTYALLFVIIFAETGLVVTPFLPGDSLLFAAGALSVGSTLNVHLLVLILAIAAILGNTVNYAAGAFFGPKVFTREDSWLLRKKHLERAHAFFETYGARSIILTRFMPIIRTFVPFVAGVGRMPYHRFFIFNFIGGCAWIAGLTYLGYFFGGTEIVRKNFSFVVLAIIAISLLPMVIELGRAWWLSRRAPSPVSAR